MTTVASTEVHADPRPDGRRKRAIRTEGLAVRFAHPLIRKSIPGIVSASFIQDLIKVSVAEADFTIRLSLGPDTTVWLEFTAVFREPVHAGEPGGTWWNTWSIESDSRDSEHIGELLASQLTESRRKFTEALSDAQRCELQETH